MNKRSVLSQKHRPFLNAFSSCVALCSVVFPHMCLVPLASLFCPCHPPMYVFPLPSPDKRHSSVMCYIPSSRGNDCTDYVKVTAAGYIAVSTCFHFPHTSPCAAVALSCRRLPNPPTSTRAFTSCSISICCCQVFLSLASPQGLILRD